MEDNKKYSVEKIRRVHPKAYVPWTQEEDKELLEAYNNRVLENSENPRKFTLEFSHKLGRLRGAIRSRIKKLTGKSVISSRGISTLEPLGIAPDVDNINTAHSFFKDLGSNAEAQKAYRLMEDTTKNLFITGRAGTGKSTLLQHFREKTRKNIVVLAPTGVAALNVRGQTIHSFFSFGPGITPEMVKTYYGRKAPLFRKLDAIVIDEISMVRADLLDCIDRFMRINGRHKDRPFGGVQMILFGDLHQLPPVVPSEEQELFRKHYDTPHFFGAKSYAGLNLEYIELQNVYRQKDKEFLDILDSIRVAETTNSQLKILNSRAIKSDTNQGKDLVVRLVPTNQMADSHNLALLRELTGKMYSSEAIISGDFGKNYFPTNYQVHFKEGAQVMVLNNDSAGRWVNGDIGRIENILEEEQGAVLRVRFVGGKAYDIGKYTWEIIKFFYNQNSRRIESRIAGTFIQYPIRLAWSVTIHKSQGKTFDRVVVDFGRGVFAPGQAYVALSRCRTLDGLSLISPLEQRHVFSDQKIINFLNSLSRNAGPVKD